MGAIERSQETLQKTQRKFSVALYLSVSIVSRSIYLYSSIYVITVYLRLCFEALLLLVIDPFPSFIHKPQKNRGAAVGSADAEHLIAMVDMSGKDRSMSREVKEKYDRANAAAKTAVKPKKR